MKINELWGRVLRNMKIKHSHSNAKNNTAKESKSNAAAPVGSDAKDDRLPWHKRPWVHKLGYLILSLLIATTLWGYVLTSENPERRIRIENIPVTFEAGSESDLYSRNLTILGDIDDIMPTISVTVKTSLTDLPRFKGRESDIVKATISLNSVHSTGEYSLPVNVTTSIGEIDRISIENVIISVDNLVERTIPISAITTGKLPDGYWNGELQLLTNNISLRGAESEMASIVKAVCTVDLTNRVESVNDSFTLALYDKENNIVNASSVIGSIPSVTVRMDILPKLDIPLNVNITGVNDMKDIYEIAQTSIFPSSVSIAADADTLSNIRELISLESIDISNINEEGTIEREVKLIGLPSDAILINGIDAFTVTIEIRERMESITFENRPVTFINEDGQSYTYSYEPAVVTITLSGKASLIRSLYTWNISLTVNMAGIDAGVHTIIPELEIINKPGFIEELEYDITPIACTVTSK